MDKVVVDYRRDGSEILVNCGDYFGGDMVLCGRHEAQAKRRYPQGWRSYPGDVCRHGSYVGGCGRDYMCFHCEMGE